MSNHFDELEEKLRELETIPLVSPGGQARAEDPETVRSAAASSSVQRNSRTPEAGREQECLSECHDETEPGSLRMPARSRRSGWVARVISNASERKTRNRLRILEDQAITECRERMRQALGEFVEDARRQLEALSGQWVPSFQLRMEKSIETSVRILTSQLTQSLEQQFQAAGLLALLAPISVGTQVTESASAEREIQESLAVEPFRFDQRVEKQLVQAFTPVVEEIQAKSAAFLDRLTVQLHSAARAFGAKATKHAAERFQRIAVEVLQREARHLQGVQGESTGSARNLLFAAIEEPSADVQGQQHNARPKAVAPTGREPDQPTKPAQSRDDQAAGRHQELSTELRELKSRCSTAPSWRILGLS